MDKLKELIAKYKQKYIEWQEIEEAYGFDNDMTGQAFNDCEDAEHELLDYILTEYKED